MLGYNTPPEYLEYVDPFWRSFEAPNPFLNYTLGFFYIIFTFCSVIGNGVVIWVFATHHLPDHLPCFPLSYTNRTYHTTSLTSLSDTNPADKIPLFCLPVRSKSLRTPSNMFVINLALMDFIMMLKTPVFILNSFNDGPVWGKLGCDIYGLMGAFSGVGAASSNAVIAYDRYK
ncbi:Opsin, ultraviolet-sensitive [Portunus trituberculatus]|uniref:Opsin, ultraviolet-sensitive n=1 Tax=Portunus trituberculatus TaxID=210409 RepID=A0A5B7JEA9_PORTR|nr:Opsin, ultraviolet-sensitive [Portunus trituberculatus]